MSEKDWQRFLAGFFDSCKFLAEEGERNLKGGRANQAIRAYEDLLILDSTNREAKEKLMEAYALRDRSLLGRLLYRLTNPTRRMAAALSTSFILLIVGLVAEAYVILDLRGLQELSRYFEQVNPIEPTGKLQYAPRIFSWSACPRAEYYVVTVLTEDLRQVIWQASGIKATEALVPDNVRHMLGKMRGGKCLWKVEAFWDGQMTAKSRFAEFEIGP